MSSLSLKDVSQICAVEKHCIITDDLQLLYTATFGARNKWRNILLNLKVSIATIESIGTKFREDPDDCYREGLIEWLKGGERSWEDVVDALCSPIVGHSDIATTVERNHILRTATSHDVSSVPAVRPISMDSSRSSGVWSIAEKYTELRRISFQCGCGNCTALGFIKGKDRCRSKKLPQVKVWTPETLSPVDRITKTELPYSIFEEALKDETRKVFDSFCSLLHATFKMLQKNATFDDVKGFVSSLLARRTYYGEIYSEVESQHFGLIRNFSDLREYLEINCCSWFNYKIIVALRKQFRRNRSLKKDDKLATYKDLFNQYVNRRSFLFLDDLGPELPQESSVNVICKIDVDFTTITPQQIAHLKKVLIECIQQISEYSLTLKNVKDGCTELTFRAPAYLRGIKELTPTQVNQLQQNRFLLLKIDNKIFLSTEAQSEETHGIGTNLSGLCTTSRGLLKAFQEGDALAASHLMACEDCTNGIDKITDTDKMSLLHLACRWDWVLWEQIIIDLVTKYKCTVSALNEDGDTPLHVACRFNNEKAVHFLLTLDECNPVAQNIAGVTALQIADEKQHHGVLRQLLFYSAKLDFDVEDSIFPSNYTAPSTNVHHHFLRERMEMYGGNVVQAQKLRSRLEGSTTSGETSVESSLTDASIRCGLTRDSEALLKPANKRCLPAEQTYHHSGNIPDTKTISVRRYNQQLRLDCSFKDTYTRKNVCLAAVMVLLFVIAVVCLVLASSSMAEQNFESTLIVQLPERSSVFINSFMTKTLTLSITSTDSKFEVNLFAPNCATIMLEEVTIDKEGNFSSTAVNYHVLDERYVSTSGVLEYQFDMPSSFAGDCPITLVIFDDLSSFEQFRSTGTWLYSYTEMCIQNNQNIASLTLQAKSYYFAGVYISPQLKPVPVTYKINGTLQQYLPTSLDICTITPDENSTCTFQALGTSEVCILGSVPRRSSSEIVKAEISYHLSTDSASITGVAVTATFGIVSFILLVSIFIAIVVVYIVRKRNLVRVL